MPCRVADIEQSSDECDYTIENGWRRLCVELIYQTIRDAYHCGVRDGRRFKACGGNRPWDEASTLNRAHRDIVGWIDSDLFERCMQVLQINYPNAREMLREILSGKDLERVKSLLDQINHDARVFGRRGPERGVYKVEPVTGAPDRGRKHHWRKIQ